MIERTFKEKSKASVLIVVVGAVLIALNTIMHNNINNNYNCARPLLRNLSMLVLTALNVKRKITVGFGYQTSGISTTPIVKAPTLVV
jgi:hypothetical protein